VELSCSDADWGSTDMASSFWLCHYLVFLSFSKRESEKCEFQLRLCGKGRTSWLLSAPTCLMDRDAVKIKGAEA
jgi:hypothetical protein